MTYPEVMPARVGVRLAHAAVQSIADSAGVDMLHIKGPAVDPELLEARAGEAGEVGQVVVERPSLDADILVRPDHVLPMMTAMRQHGWILKVDFADGSAFEHAATMGHPRLAHVDVHRRFPGLGSDPDRAFRALWRGRMAVDIAGYPCPVPNTTAQRLVLLLNAVRSGPSRRGEIERLWDRASPEEKAAVRMLAAETGAQVALAAATGSLQNHVGSREHDLWQLLSIGHASPIALWRARVRAQPTLRSALREAVKLIVPNPRRLALQRGRPLTRREMAAAWAGRFRAGMRALRETVASPFGRAE